MNALEILSDGPESPSPPGQAAPEVAGSASPDDFGLLRALPLAIGGGLLLWGCVAAAWIALK